MTIYVFVIFICIGQIHLSSYNSYNKSNENIFDEFASIISSKIESIKEAVYSLLLKDTIGDKGSTAYKGLFSSELLDSLLSVLPQDLVNKLIDCVLSIVEEAKSYSSSKVVNETNSVFEDIDIDIDIKENNKGYIYESSNVYESNNKRGKYKYQSNKSFVKEYINQVEEEWIKLEKESQEYKNVAMKRWESVKEESLRVFNKAKQETEDFIKRTTQEVKWENLTFTVDDL